MSNCNPSRSSEKHTSSSHPHLPNGVFHSTPITTSHSWTITSSSGGASQNLMELEFPFDEFADRNYNQATTAQVPKQDNVPATPGSCASKNGLYFPQQDLRAPLQTAEQGNMSPSQISVEIPIQIAETKSKMQIEITDPVPEQRYVPVEPSNIPQVNLMSKKQTH